MRWQNYGNLHKVLTNNLLPEIVYVYKYIGSCKWVDTLDVVWLLLRELKRRKTIYWFPISIGAIKCHVMGCEQFFTFDSLNPWSLANNTEGIFSYTSTVGRKSSNKEKIPLKFIWKNIISHVHWVHVWDPDRRITRIVLSWHSHNRRLTAIDILNLDRIPCPITNIAATFQNWTI